MNRADGPDPDPEPGIGHSPDHGMGHDPDHGDDHEAGRRGSGGIGNRSGAGDERQDLTRQLAESREHDFVGQRDLTRWPSAAGRRLAHLALGLGRRLAPHQVLLLTLGAGLLLTAALAALADGVYDSVAEDDGVAELDHPALALALRHRTPLLNSLVTGFTHVGGPVGMPVLAAVTAVALSLAWRHRTPAVLVVTTMLGSLALTVAGKAAVTRARPAHTDAVPPYEFGFSFPSGHSLNAVAFAGIVAYLLLRRLERSWARRLTVVLAITFAAAMGLSRVFLGHHWLTDVLVGWVLGLAWLGVVVTGHRLFLTLHRVAPTDATYTPGATPDTPTAPPPA